MRMQPPASARSCLAHAHFLALSVPFYQISLECKKRQTSALNMFNIQWNDWAAYICISTQSAEILPHALQPANKQTYLTLRQITDVNSIRLFYLLRYSVCQTNNIVSLSYKAY